MRFARYRHTDRVHLGRVDGDSVSSLISGDDTAGPDLYVRHLRGESGEPSAPVALADVELLAPLARPQRILCIGLNYVDHVAESQMQVPPQPVLFAKFQNCIANPGQPVRVHRSDTQQLDWEVELAAVIGRRASRVSPGDALSYVGAYTVCNDVSARDVQFEPGGQWLHGKTFDGFFPLGPFLVTADEIGDPQGLGISAEIGGELMQSATTADMIFDVRTLVSHLSRTITLEPGDVIATGTPPGVGWGRDPKRFLQDGELMRLTIEGIGTLENRVQLVAD